MNKKNKKITIVSVLMVALFIFCFSIYDKYSSVVTTDNAYTKADIVSIAPKVSGYVNKVFIKDNQKVKKGDLLFTIEDSDYKLKLDLEKANVKAIESNIKNLEEQIYMQKSTIAEAQANYNSAISEQKLVELNYQRLKRLKKSNAISKQDFDVIQNEKNQADFNVMAKENKLDLENKRLNLYLTNKETVEFQMQQAIAKVELAKLDMNYTKVVAPFDGIVANRQVQVGKYVNKGTSMLSLVDTNNIWLVANFKETQISDINLGDKVDIEIDGLKDKTLEGTVESFSPGSGASFSMIPSDNATGNFVRVVQRVPVKIVFDTKNYDKKLMPGLSANITINKINIYKN